MNIQAGNTDSDLVDLLRGGDKLAFKSLFDKYGARLYAFAMKYLRDKEDAEDLLNEVFLKIWENRHSLKTHLSFQAYLFTIAYNNIRLRFLKKCREEKYVRIFAEEYLSETSKTEEQLDYNLFTQKIDQIIDMLPPRRKEVFTLSYKQELKNHQIAEQLGVSEYFVKNQLAIARKFILDKVKEGSFLALILFFFLSGQKLN